MKIAIAPVRNPATGWDITVTVLAEDKERIAQVTTVINDFPEQDDILNPQANSYERTYIQKGIFPGHNKVVVTALDSDGNPWVGVKKWDSA